MLRYPVSNSQKSSSENIKFSSRRLTTPLCSAVASPRGFGPTQWVGACLLPHPAALHTSQGRSIMVCLMQGETSIIRAEAETTAGITKDGGGWGAADAGHNWLCCRLAPLILALMAVWWVHTGWHGFIRTCLHVHLHNVYAQPTNSFFLDSEGGFSCGRQLRKKQLRIPKQHTTMGDIICAMCVPCLSQFLSGMGLAIFNLRTTEPTYRQTTNWMKGRGVSGHGNCLLWSSNSSVLP